MILGEAIILLPTTTKPITFINIFLFPIAATTTKNS
jgi:hypothetical protein